MKTLGALELRLIFHLALSLSLSLGGWDLRSIDSKGGVILGGYLAFDNSMKSHSFLLYVVGLWTGVRDTSDGVIRDERDTAR